MAKQVLNNQETGLVARTKLNANFTDLFNRLQDQGFNVTPYVIEGETTQCYKVQSTRNGDQYTIFEVRAPENNNCREATLALMLPVIQNDDTQYPTESGAVNIRNLVAPAGAIGFQIILGVAGAQAGEAIDVTYKELSVTKKSVETAVYADLNTDTNNNGIVDGWNFEQDGYNLSTSVSAGGQRFNGTAAASGYLVMYKNFSCNAGDPLQLRILLTATSLPNNATGVVRVRFYGESGFLDNGVWGSEFADVSMMRYGDFDDGFSFNVQKRGPLGVLHPLIFQFKNSGSDVKRVFRITPDYTVELLRRNAEDDVTRFMLGDYGILQDRMHNGDSSSAANRRSCILYNCYVSTQATNTYTRISTSVDCYKIEFDGTTVGGGIKFYRVAAGSGTFTESSWELLFNSRTFQADLSRQIVPISDDYVLTDIKAALSCNCTAKNITVQLPDLSSFTKDSVIITKIDSTAHTVEVLPFGGQTIAGYSSLVIRYGNNSATLLATTTGWIII